MAKSIAIFCALLILGSFAAASAATVNIGYVIVTEYALNPSGGSTATLALDAHYGTGSVAGELVTFPVLTNVAITSAVAKLYKSGTPLASPDRILTWTDTPMVASSPEDYNPKDAGIVDTFDTAEDYTSAVVTFRISPVGLWSTAIGNFTLIGNESTDYSATIANPLGLHFASSTGGLSLVSGDLALLSIPGDITTHTPEPATTSLFLCGLGFAAVAALRQRGYNPRRKPDISFLLALEIRGTHLLIQPQPVGQSRHLYHRSAFAICFFVVALAQASAQFTVSVTAITPPQSPRRFHQFRLPPVDLSVP